MKLSVLLANPSGNVTLFVLDPVPARQRAQTAAQLMERLPDWGIEQVGFFCPPVNGGEGRLEMAGGEFCGNAARAFGMLLAKLGGMRGPTQMRVEVSGCPDCVSVESDVSRGVADAEMPLPLFTRPVDLPQLHGTLVHLGGIAHLVLPDTKPEENLLHLAKPLFRSYPELSAYGLVFQSGPYLTPLVRVPEAGTMVWEGSCGSGTVAAAIVESLHSPQERFTRDYIHPAGIIRATVCREGEELRWCKIGGEVLLGSPEYVEL